MSSEITLLFKFKWFCVGVGLGIVLFGALIYVTR